MAWEKNRDSVVSPPLLRSVNGAVNTTSTEILVLTSTSAKECYPRIHRLSLFSSLLSPFLSRSPSPSGQSVEIVAVAEDDPRTEEEAVAEEIPDTKHVALYTKNKIPLLKLIFVLLIYYLK